jgi:hypothetical protein
MDIGDADSDRPSTCLISETTQRIYMKFSLGVYMKNYPSNLIFLIIFWKRPLLYETQIMFNGILITTTHPEFKM